LNTQLKCYRPPDAEPEEGKSKKKGAESKTQPEQTPAEEGEGKGEAAETDEAGSTVKSAAQKKREKREREKMKKQAQKQVMLIDYSRVDQRLITTQLTVCALTPRNIPTNSTLVSTWVTPNSATHYFQATLRSLMLATI
jgi:hypothetical protein